MKLSKISACGVLSSNRKPIEPGVKVRHVAFIYRDGPRHEGVVNSIEWFEDKPPVIVVDMLEGGQERWGTTWTAEGPWEPQAPFRTDRGNVIGPRGAIL